jgi:hypothetical protein
MRSVFHSCAAWSYRRCPPRAGKSVIVSVSYFLSCSAKTISLQSRSAASASNGGYHFTHNSLLVCPEATFCQILKSQGALARRTTQQEHAISSVQSVPRLRSLDLPDIHFLLRTGSLFEPTNSRFQEYRGGNYCQVILGSAVIAALSGGSNHHTPPVRHGV